MTTPLYFTPLAHFIDNGVGTMATDKHQLVLVWNPHRKNGDTRYGLVYLYSAPTNPANRRAPLQTEKECATGADSPGVRTATELLGSLADSER